MAPAAATAGPPQAAWQLEMFPIPASFAALLLAAALALLGAAPALAAPPIVESVSFSHVGETGLTLEATIDPNGSETPVYHFQYTTLAKFEESGFAGAAETPDGPPLAASAAPAPISASLTGLEAATAYRFRVFAENRKGEQSESPPVAFATYAAPLVGLPDGRAYEQASPVGKDGGDVTDSASFARAAADGNAVAFGSVGGIPGGEGAQQFPFFSLATRSGEGASASWLTGGLLPPAAIAPAGKLLGWTPEFSRVYQEAVQFGAGGLSSALLERPGAGGAVTEITPFVKGRGLAFAGASADGSEAIFESRSGQLATTPPGVEGRSNVYAWDAATQTLSLVSRMNGEGAEVEAEDAEKLPAGAFAGPYDWAKKDTAQGGAARLYYTGDTNAVAADGSVFFTAAGSGHLYERRNPTQPQSAMEGERCTEPAKACTLDVSASRRPAPDAGGPQPAAFQYASPDGSTALFTSSQKLTEDATTGPEVPPPAIGRLTLDGSEEAEEELDGFLAGKHAAGVAVEGDHIYWVDPTKGTIARATLNPSGPPTDVDESFIEPAAAGETCFETRPDLEPGKEQCAPSTPRYLAAGGEYVYWTNTGPLGGEVNRHPTEEPVRGAGTIGRAKIDPVTEEAEEIEPAFIKGASDPQGIAVNESHIYWANSFNNAVSNEDFIARAQLEGDQVEQRFFALALDLQKPFGLALSATRVYWVQDTVISSIPLEGGSGADREDLSNGEFSHNRGIALAGNHLYWTDQATGAIGRIRLPLHEPSDPSSELCSEIARCEGEFAKPGGALLGLAAEASGSHLYWAANGESPPHPGNDLYRYRAAGTGGCAEAAGCLEDLSADSEEENGAEVLGVVGASADASRVYFVANGVLSEAPNQAGEVARPGTCRGPFGLASGRCNLYLAEGGTIGFIARLDPEGNSGGDSTDWVPSVATDIFGGLTEKSAFASADGRTLLFRSREKLTPYENEGAEELYLYRLDRGTTCVSCNPTGAPPGGDATLGTIGTPLLEPLDTTAVAARNLAADGQTAFFESVDPLVAGDANGSGGCPRLGTSNEGIPACRDVYEWEAPGAPGGSCTESSPAYSPPNQGCLYLISTGKSDYPSLFLDASESGRDVFFFTRSRLVGQDQDQLLDVYDARVEGGIPSQSPPPSAKCEGEACLPGPSAPPAAGSPATPGFQGEGNVHQKPPKPHCPKGKVKHHGKCVKQHKRHQGGHR